MKILRYIPGLIIGFFIVFLIAACASGSKEAAAPEDVEMQAFDDLKKQILEIIHDPLRQTEVIAHVDQLQIDYKSLKSIVTTRKLKLRELYADYDMPREKFYEHITTHDSQIKSSQKQLVDSHRALVHATTVEEWSALTKASTKSMGTLAKSLKSI